MLMPCTIPGVTGLRIDPETQTVAVVSRELAEKLDGEWSAPLQVRVALAADGTAEITFRTLPRQET